MGHGGGGSGSAGEGDGLAEGGFGLGPLLIGGVDGGQGVEEVGVAAAGEGDGFLNEREGVGRAALRGIGAGGEVPGEVVQRAGECRLGAVRETIGGDGVGEALFFLEGGRERHENGGAALLSGALFRVALEEGEGVVEVAAFGEFAGNGEGIGGKGR